MRQYIFKSHGKFNFCRISVDLALQISNSAADSILYAELTDSNAREVVISELSDKLTESQQSTPWHSLILPDDFYTFGFINAKLNINLSKNTFILFGSSDKFGKIGLLTKKLEENKWGYFVAAALTDNFQFASICSSLSVIDDVITIKRAGFCVSSFSDNSVQGLTAGMPEFNDIILLPATSNVAPVHPGLTIFGTVVFKGDLFGNVRKIIHGLNEDDGITIYAFISKTAGYSIFKASIGTFSLFDAVNFEKITLSFQPKSNTDPNITNILMLSGTMKIIVDDKNQPSFDGRLRINNQQADLYIETTGELHSPWSMFNITLKNLKLSINYTFPAAKDLNTSEGDTNVNIALSGTIGFGSVNPQGEYPVVLSGELIFDNGSPEVCAVSLDKALSVDDLLTTILPDNLWPTGWLDITFQSGSIYYAKKAGSYLGTVYRQGYNMDSKINIYGLIFTICVQVLNSGLIIDGRASNSIDLIFAKLTDKNFTNSSPNLIISTVGQNKRFGFSAGVQMFSHNIGTAEMDYSITNSQFEGTVSYNGTILGTQNPSIKFAWTKENGFQILDIPLSLDSNEYDYTKKIEELSKEFSSGTKCAQLIGIVFDKVVTNKYSVNVDSKKISADKDKVTIPLSIICTVLIAGQNVLAESAKIPLVINKPKEITWDGFLDALLNSVINSADSIVEDMLENPSDFAKFIGAAGLKTAAQEALVSLMCRGVKSDQVKINSENKVDDNVSEASETAEAAEEAAEAAEAAATATEAAAAGIAAEEAVPAIAAIVAGIAALVTGLFSAFGINKSKEEEEAENKKKAAEAARERVRRAVEDKLKISTPTIAYNPDDTICVNCEPIAGGGNITYKYVLYKNNQQIGEKSQSQTGHTFSNSLIEPGESYKVTIQATLYNGNYEYTGEAVEQSINVPAISPPKSLAIIQIEKDFTLTWQTGDKMNVSYIVRVKDSEGNILLHQPAITIIDTKAIVKGDLLCAGQVYQFSVRAYDSDKTVYSKWSSISAVYSSMEPPKQIQCQLQYNADMTITITSIWEAAQGADHYVVKVLDDNHQLIVPAPVISINGCSAVINSPSFEIGKIVWLTAGSQNQSNSETVWAEEVMITFSNPSLELARKLKAEGKNLYQTAEAIFKQLPQTAPVIMANVLYSVYQPPILEPKELSWGLWFGGVKENDAKQALKSIYPDLGENIIDEAIAYSYHADCNRLAIYLKQAGYDEIAATAKMVQVIVGLNIVDAANGLYSAGYSLLRSTAALKHQFNPLTFELAENIEGSFMLGGQYGILPLGAALNYSGCSFEEVAGSLRKLYPTTWNLNIFKQLLDLYSNNAWMLAINDYDNGRSAVQIAVNLKNTYPTIPPLDLVVILSAVCDLYMPHISVPSMTQCIKAVAVSIIDTTGSMRHIYAPDWTIDDYSIVLRIYNDN